MLAAEIFYFFRLDTYRMCNAVGYVGDKGLHAEPFFLMEKDSLRQRGPLRRSTFLCCALRLQRLLNQIKTEYDWR